jgi:enoyl-[acyl-carrier-protein] reductase (NADH)
MEHLWSQADATRRQPMAARNGTKAALRTHPQRVMTLEEVANMAVFMASDKASGMTGTTVNLTMGSLDD